YTFRPSVGALAACRAARAQGLPGACRPGIFGVLPGAVPDFGGEAASILHPVVGVASPHPCAISPAAASPTAPGTQASGAVLVRHALATQGARNDVPHQENNGWLRACRNARAGRGSPIARSGGRRPVLRR